jgi:hypothetical protein
MADAGQQVPGCAYPGCENEIQPVQEGLTAEPAYCGLPDPVTGQPHTALTAFRQRQVLAGPTGEAAAAQEARRQGFAAWRRRASAQRRQQAEAEAAEARSAALQADTLLVEALAAKADAEQEAATARARAFAARQAAEERVAAVQRERDDAVAQAQSQAMRAAQDAARAREIAQSARAELDRARVAADLQARKNREDAARRQAELRAAFEDQLAAAGDARAALQARAERAEAELQHVLTDRDQAPEKAPAAPSPRPARRRRIPPET